MKFRDTALKHLDLLMWNVDHPTGLTNITAMMFFKTKLSEQKVIQILDERIKGLKKFQEKVIDKSGRPTWHFDELFDINSHIHKVALPDGGDDKALMKMVSDLISMPLDYTKPLWQIHLIENYYGGSALLWRIHHAIGDGASLVNAMLTLTDHQPNASIKKELSTESQRTIKTKTNWKEKLKQGFKLVEKTYVQSKKIITKPDELNSIISVVKDSTNDLVSFLKSSDNKNSIYKGKLGVQKKVAWSKEMALSDIKKISKYYNAKVNDTLLAILTGALRRHMEKHQQDTGITFNIACPVDMRKNDNEMDLGNKVGAILIQLPINTADFGERMQRISKKTQQLKKSLEPPLAYYYTEFISDLIPKEIELYAAKMLGSKLMAILSNVPGPKQPIYFAGEEIDNIMFWLPHTYSMGMALSVISYNNKVSIGITVDANLIQDPEEIIHNFEIELNEVLLGINKN
jgi:WS/DGAT/MGAT family acyltransferase